MVDEYFDNLYIGTQADFIAEIIDDLDNGRKRVIVTANPETIMLAEQTPEFGEMLLGGGVTIVPDGIGVVKAAEYLGLETHGRVTGVELASALLEHAGERGQKIFLYGAGQEVVQALADLIKSKHANANIAGCYCGYGNDDDEIMEKALLSEADVILVALGIPRQELLINKWQDKFRKGIFVGVGGSFDVLSGAKKRAPAFFVKLNLEWLYRILKEPSRFKRFYNSNVKFLAEVKKAKKLRDKRQAK